MCVLQVVKICLGVVNPLVNLDALSGLISLLRSQAPTGPLLNTVLSLSPKFGRFVAVVLAGWMASHYSLLLSCLRQLGLSGEFKDSHNKKGEAFSDTKSGLQRFVLPICIFPNICKFMVIEVRRCSTFRTVL